MTIGERIKKLREEKGIAQAELAKAANTSKQNIYKYENGIITNIPSDKIESISLKLGVSPAYLMGWEDAIHGDEIDLGYAAIMLRKNEGLDIDTAIKKTEELAEYFKDYFSYPDIQHLLDNYRKLNDTGKNKLVSYSDDLAANPANTETSHIYKIAARDGGVKEVELSDDQIKEMMDAPDWSDEI